MVRINTKACTVMWRGQLTSLEGQTKLLETQSEQTHTKKEKNTLKQPSKEGTT